MSAAPFTKKAVQFARGGQARADITLTRHIQLHNVPKSAQPADIWRLVSRMRLENVDAADIDYKHLRPTGSAWLTLSNPAFSDGIMRKFLNPVHIGASEVRASKDARQSAEFLTRARGEKGRAEAANRGILGSGPSGKLSAGAKSVCLSGLPDYTTSEFVKNMLKSFKFTTSGEKEVVKFDSLTRDSYNNGSSRFLIRLSSSSEAHRLVRKLHMTDYDEAMKNRKWRLKAHIIY